MNAYIGLRYSLCRYSHTCIFYFNEESPDFTDDISPVNFYGSIMPIIGNTFASESQPTTTKSGLEPRNRIIQLKNRNMPVKQEQNLVGLLLRPYFLLLMKSKFLIFFVVAILVMVASEIVFLRELFYLKRIPLMISSFTIAVISIYFASVIVKRSSTDKG